MAVKPRPLAKAQRYLDEERALYCSYLLRPKFNDMTQTPVSVEFACKRYFLSTKLWVAFLRSVLGGQELVVE